MAYKSKFMQEMEQQGKISAAQTEQKQYKSKFFQSGGHLGKEVTPAPMRSPTDQTFPTAAKPETSKPTIQEAKSPTALANEAGASVTGRLGTSLKPSTAYMAEISGLQVQEAQNKLNEAQKKITAAEQRAAQILSQRKDLETAAKGIQELRGKYELSGSDVDAQAYLLAMQEYQKLYEAAQENQKAYEKESSAFAEYDNALLKYEKVRLQNEKLLAQQSEKQEEDHKKLWQSGPVEFIDRTLSAFQAGQTDWLAGVAQIDRKIGNAALHIVGSQLYGMAMATGNDGLLKTATDILDQSRTESEDAAAAMKASQDYMAEALQGTGKVDGWIIQQMQSVGSMMMDMMAAGSTSAMGLPEGADTGKIMAIRAAGSGMLNAQEKGYSETEQILVGIANGALEYASEQMFGGNPIYDTDKGWVTAAVEKAVKNPKITKLMYSKGFDILSEGLEEVFTEFVEPIAEGLLTSGDIEMASAEDLANAFAGGMFLSLTGQGASVVVREVSGAGNAERSAGRFIRNADAVQELVNEGLEADPRTEAYRQAAVLKKKLDAGKKISNAEVGRLLYANQEAIDAGLLTDSEMEPDQTAPEGALRDPETGYFAIETQTEADGKVSYQLAQVQEDGKIQNIGEPVGDLMAAKRAAQAQGMNVRNIGAAETLRDTVQSTVDQVKPKDSESTVTENAADNENTGLRWAGNEEGVYDYGTEQRNMGTGADQERVGGYAAEPTGRSTRQKYARATVGRAEEASRIRRNVQTVGGEVTSLRELGVKIATEDTFVTEVPRAAWTERVRGAYEAAESEGLQFVPVIGTMEVETDSGTARVNGIFDPETGTIYARADAGTAYVDETTMHEVFHFKASQDPELVGRVRAYLLRTYTEEQLQEMAGRYYEDFQEVYSGRASDEALEELIWEEMLADAYAEYQRYRDVDVTEFAADVQEAVWAGREQDNGNSKGQVARTSKESTFQSGEIYTYDYLVSQPDMKIVQLPEVEEVRNDRSRVEQRIAIKRGIENARSVGTERDGKIYVQNAYTGRDIRVDVETIRHSLNGDYRRVLTNARLGAAVGDVIQNAIPVNALYNTAGDVDGTYAMAGLATDSKGREFVAIITVEQRMNEVSDIELLDVAHAVNGRQRKSSQADTKSQGVDPIKAATISIADFLDIVKQTHQSVLSEDVLARFGETRNREGTYTGKVKFSLASPVEQTKTNEPDPVGATNNLRGLAAKIKFIRESVAQQSDDVNTRFSVSSEDRARQRAERELARGIGDIMSMPTGAVRQLQTGLVREIMEEYQQTGELNMEKLADVASNAFAQGLLIDTEYYETYKHIKDRLRSTAVTISQQDQADIADYTQFRKRAFGTLRIVKQGGIPVDSLYQELMEDAPGLFPRTITHPADQLVKMYEVAREIRRVETPLERAMGDQSDQFYEWAEGKIADLTERVLTRYADSVKWKQPREQTRQGLQLTDDTPDSYDRANERMFRAGQERMGGYDPEYQEGEPDTYDPTTQENMERFGQEIIDDYEPTPTELGTMTEEEQARRGSMREWIQYVLSDKLTPEQFAEKMRQSSAGELRGGAAKLAERMEETARQRQRDGENLYRDPDMTDEEYEALNTAWKNRKRRRDAEKAPETAAEIIIPKNAFRSTPAMDKLGIKIDGSVTRYRETAQLRAYNEAAEKAQRMLNRRIRKLNATKQEMALAKLLVSGSITADALNTDTVNVEVIAELADYLFAAQSFNEDRSMQRRSEINTNNLKVAKELFQDSEAYHPQLPGRLAGLTKLVMNERTPERVVKQIFGSEQGEKIYETYFRPVWVNGAEMNRFENRMLKRVEAFKDENGRTRPLTEKEREFAQRLMEGEAVRERMENLAKEDPDARERIEAAAQNVNNGMDYLDAVRDQNIQEEEHQGLVQAYADYMDTVTMSQDMDQTILWNAIREYQQIYNEMYEAMNDFLVSHGYKAMGFIKGYAPHFQKREVQQGLFGALKALGVEKESVTELPASIAGRTADFKPNMKWNPHMQSRKGETTSYDIQMGFEQYLHYAAEMFYHTDDVMRIRQAVNWMRGQYSGEEISQEIQDAEVDRFKSVEWKRDFLIRKEIIRPQDDLDGRAIDMAYQEYVDGLFERVKPESLKRYSEFVTWLDNYANIVAGKQSLADRGLEYGGGRTALNMGSKLMRRFASANVAGNISSVLNQSAQLPLLQKELKGYLELAMFDLARGSTRKENFAERSDFLTDKRGVEKLTTDNMEKFISGLFKPAEMMDRLVSTLAVRGRYRQALAQNMTPEEAMKAADDFGRRVMGSRMKGAKPLGYESKTFVNQMLHVFQLEASNTFDYMLLSDMPQAVREVRKTKGKAAAARYTAAAVLGYLINAFLLNTITDELYGGSPAPFDVIGWMLNFVAGGWGRDDEEFVKTVIDNAWERAFGERPFETEPIDREEGFQWAGAMDDLGYNVLGDVPYVRNALGLAGVGDQSLPTVGINEFFEGLWGAGKTLWNQATKGQEETGLDWAGAVAEAGESLGSALTQIVPGGRQLSKSAQGIRAMIQGGKYSGWGENAKLQYPVDQNAWNVIREGLFGLSALDETDAFYAGEKALTAAQTQKAKELETAGVDIEQTYGLYQEFAEINSDLNRERIGSIEAKQLKRDLIDSMDLTDEQKLEVYMQTLASGSDRAKANARAKYETLLGEGVSWSQITSLENDYASFNEDADDDGEADMDSLERGIAKRNAIAALDLTNEQKLAVFDEYHLDKESKNYEATLDELHAMLDAGLSWDDVTAAHNTYATLNADEELNATQKATEYAKWADEQGWTASQKTAVKDRYTFWQMIPAEATSYEKFTGAGLSSDNADKVTKALAELEPEAGRESVSTVQKLEAIAKGGFSAADERKAMRGVMTEEQAMEFDDLMEAGLTPKQYAQYRRAVYGLASDKDANGNTVSGSKKKKVLEAIDRLPISDALKTELYYAEGYSESTLDEAPWY